MSAVERWLLTPAPARRLAALRILIGGYGVVYLAIRFRSLSDLADLPAELFQPVGPLAWMSDPLGPGGARLLLVLTLVAGIAFVAGWRWRLAGPLFAIGFLAVTTYAASWGHVSHADHLPALSLLVLAFVPAADAWSVDARRPQPGLDPDRPDVRYGWPIRVLGVVVVVTYVLAGLAKLRYGGWGWIDGEVLRHQLALNNLLKALIGGQTSTIGGRLAGVSWLFPPLALATLAVELSAPVALLGGRLRTVWVVACWLFHLGIVALMAISFPYPLSGVAFAPFFRVERLFAPVVAWLASRSGAVPARSGR